MKSRTLRAIAVVLLLVCGVGRPSAAVAADAGSLKGEIENFVHRFLLTGRGMLDWDGAETFDVKQDGDSAVAVITNARILVHPPGDAKKLVATLTLDRLEVRRKPAAQGGDFVEYAARLPRRWEVAVAEGGGKVTLSLDDARLTAVVEGPELHQRSLVLTVAGGHIEVGGSESKAGFGPVAGHWKLAAKDDGSWHTPADLEVKGITAHVAEEPLDAGIERVAYHGDSNGPNVAAYDAFRDQAIAAREEIDRDADRAPAISLNLIAKALAAFTGADGEVTVENISARRPDGETLVTLKKATFGGSIDCLGGDKATLRFSLGHDGLTIASSLLPAARVPRDANVEFGIENIAGSVLRTVTEAATLAPDASDSDRQAAMAQIFAAALSLRPVFRIYDATVDFPDVSLNATAEAKRAAPLPFGFAATADIKVKNFDGLRDILTERELRDRLPLVEFIGEPDGAAGAAVLKYHVAASLSAPVTVNGSDLSGWNPASTAKDSAERPRVLAPADPPLKGDDVRAVQQAIGKSRIKPLADGVYDTATALAVMRFQKERGLNVSGVVDAATRDKLGLGPAAPGAKN